MVKKRKRIYADHTKHPDLKKMNWGQLFQEKQLLEKIVPGIDGAVNPGQAIFHSSRLKQVNKLLENWRH